MVEGTSLLRKHMGLNLYRGFDSHRLRQRIEKPLMKIKGFFFYRTENNRLGKTHPYGEGRDQIV